jgi:hypothetical protein
MTEHKKELATATGAPIGYNFIIGCDLGSGRSIQITGVLPSGVTKLDLDSEFDKIISAFDRQLAKASIDAIAKSIEEDDLRIEGLVAESAKIDSKYKGKPIPTAEIAGRENNEAQIRLMVGRRDMNKKLLEKVKKEAE